MCEINELYAYFPLLCRLPPLYIICVKYTDAQYRSMEKLA